MASGLAAALRSGRGLAAVLGILVLAGGVGRWLQTSPRVVLLSPRSGASWIGIAEPLYLGSKTWSDDVVHFRKSFVLVAAAELELEVAALRCAQVRMDGRILASLEDPASWRRARRLRAGRAAAGAHELWVTVLDRGGPAMLRLAWPGAGVVTDGSWQASRDGRSWSAARPAEIRRRVDLSEMFPSPGRALWGRLPALLCVFLLVFMWVWCRDTGQGPVWLRRWAPSPETVRWFLWGAWGLLAAVNLPRVRLNVGTDVGGHMAYIAYVAAHARLPLAGDGWQMFQAPLYYLLSAPAYAVLSHWWCEASVAHMLRLLPWFCGAVQVELGYRGIRALYPERRDLQILGMVLAGFMPMNIYLAQSVSNEGLCAALSAASLVLVWKFRLAPDAPRPEARLLAAGAVLGLAILAKTTAALLVLPLMLFLAGAVRGCWPRRRVWVGLGLFAAGIVAMAGWYYARNWMLLGRVFVGGWDPSRGWAWWQDPGFRIPSQLWVWGEALRQPVYAGLSGFWDGFYSTLWSDGNLSSMIRFESRPPWDYAYMASGVWLALLPSLGILIGTISAVFGSCDPQRPSARLAVVCLGTYLAAMLAMFLTVPAYSVVKATYTVGLLPCYALLCCRGLAWLMTGRLARAAVSAGMACWAVCAYLSYLAVPR
ncbi:MAG: hypothetical protein WC881_04535 [Elusimicrobiota bacterium]|jgi:hypothetical protein